MRPAHLPAGCNRRHWGGRYWYNTGYLWYLPYWSAGSVTYYQVYPPAGYYYETLPEGHTTETIDDETYYVADDVYYQDSETQDGYEVVDSPTGDGDDAGTAEADATGPSAYDILKTSTDFLAQQQFFALFATEETEQTLDTGETVKSTNKRTVYVRRPDAMSVEYRADDDDRRIVYAGSKLTLLSRKRKVYGEVVMPATLGETLDTLAKDYRIHVPLADLLHPQAYDLLTSFSDEGTYVGESRVLSTTCDHLTFTQGNLTWQIWIQKGAQPLPRQIVATYHTDEGAMRYELAIERWDLTPQSTVAFDIEIPEGTEQVELAPALSEDEQGEPDTEADASTGQ